MIDLNRDAPAIPAFIDPYDAVTSTDPTDRLRADWYAGYRTGVIASSSPAITANAGILNWTSWWEKYYARRLQDMIYANFNPNTLPNDFNPNSNIYLTVDKNQLACLTTEFCFAPTGVFAISSRGQVTAPSGSTPVLAETTMSCVVRVFDVLRLTTQAQFLDGLTTGQEIGSYVSQSSRNTNENSAVNYNNAHSGPNGMRLSLQSYPEPLMDRITPRLSSVDGCWLLSDYERSPYLSPTMIESIGHFNSASSWSPQAGDALPFLLDTARDVNTDGNAGMTGFAFPMQAGQSANSLTSSERSGAGNRYPDGVYCEIGRGLSYSMQSIASTFNDTGEMVSKLNKGSVRFWIKPNYHPGLSTRIRKLWGGMSRTGMYSRQQFGAIYFLSNPCTATTVRASENYDYTNSQGSTSPLSLWRGPYARIRHDWVPNRCLAFGMSWAPQEGRTLFQAHNISPTVTADFGLASGLSNASSTIFSQPWKGHEWNHVAFGWNLVFGKIRGYLNGINISNTRDGYNLVEGEAYFQTSPLYSMNLPGTAVDAYSWGERMGVLESLAAGCPPYYADATVDEIYLEDNGLNSSSGTWNVPQNTNQWSAGRYCSRKIADTGAANEQLAHYTSPRIALGRKLGRQGGDFRLRDCSWTYYRARHNRATPGQPTDNIKGVTVNPNDRRDPISRFWTNINNPGFITGVDSIAVTFRLSAAQDADGDDDGDWYPTLALASTTPKLLTYPGGSTPETAFQRAWPRAFRYDEDETFQFRAYFYLAAGQVLYESPVLDDVTLTFWRSNPAVLRYELAR